MASLLVALRRRVAILAFLVSLCLGFSLVAASVAQAQQMVASWYGPGFAGNTTACGEIFDPSDFTAASKTLPCGTKLIVSYGGRSAVVRINDRGPYVAGRDLDLSEAAANYLGIPGVATVDVQRADPSTPTGPYTPAGESSSASSTPASNSPSSASSPASGAPQAQQASPQPLLAQQASSSQTGGTAAASQYAAEENAAHEQYAAQNAAHAQYANPAPKVPRTPPAPQTHPVHKAPAAPAPRGATPPPPPEPSQLETPPPQLVKPDSTVQKAIELGFAKPPAGYTGPVPQSGQQSSAPSSAQPAPAQPREQEQSPTPENTSAQTSDASSPDAATSGEKGVGGITVLPDTGGAPLWTLMGGGSLLGLGLVSLRRTRR